ncbi:VOC family protein [Enterobacter bugandensis]|uniref:VOC family protein n=1 Tax=Enterobacter TaxID=547 RepID=UPI0018694D20|nr:MULTISPECIES: VOC family protein [Enterobacter]EKS7115859.1 VOC family protein [Enterobacter bugandensis]MBE3463473.1 VOC family protein [Enterobacter cloacae complex sp. P20C]MBE3472312.1 VOC family protein [Enterobacter cloacae complex sp. P20B]MBE3493384.1 VOC family protein [Enterobacter cloacae complex sp. P17RS]MBE3508282.1 VOC family protein [Enterobacter cloacae complex sp. I10]
MKDIDVGFTHVAFMVRDLEKSLAFYRRYAGMDVIHSREPDLPTARKVAWLTDHTRPFALVLVQADTVIDTPLGHFGHLGIACATREEIDRKTAMAAKEGVLRKAPEDLGDPVGYYVFFADPDGNTLELSYGQRVGITAIQAK